jgi:phosphoribosylanthranilate isomerase
MTRIKICGLTTVRDVKHAAGYGAWACGFVLSQSPRRIEVAQAAELTPLCGDSLAVAVVTTEEPMWIAGALAAGGFGAVQLSAGGDGPSVAAVRAAALSRGLRPLVVAAADTEDAGTADLVLLDARTPDSYGGTGRRLDWRALAAAELPRERLVLAGGLLPSNVDGAIKLVRPFAVDASSGIERTPGIKDPRLMRAFFGVVAGADISGGSVT